MMFYRGARASYDRWAELGNSGWSFSDLLPYFRKSETWEHGASEFHGGDGPVHVSMPRHRAPFSTAFVEGCREQGIPYSEDLNGRQDEGTGFYAVMQRGGRRSSAASAYLAPVRNRANLRVETGAIVNRLVLDGSRVIAVELQDREGGLQRVSASREVILSAGPLNSPKLLMLSGVGPAGHLRGLGIPVHQDLPGVGSHLLDHVRIPVLYESKRRSPADVVHWIPAGLDYAFRRRGVLTSNCCESGAVVRSSADVRIPDIQFVTHFQSPFQRGAVDLQFGLRGSSVPGTVRLTSADPTAPPAIDPNYLASEADIEIAVRGARLAREIARSTALQRFPLGREILPGDGVQTDAELEAYCRAAADTAFHAVGTCRMGNDPMAVVDDRLRVHGLDNLRIVDASIMPDIPNANTCATVLMIAEKAADLISSPGNPAPYPGSHARPPA
jgi:choline dehydrogenase